MIAGALEPMRGPCRSRCCVHHRRLNAQLDDLGQPVKEVARWYVLVSRSRLDMIKLNHGATSQLCAFGELDMQNRYVGDIGDFVKFGLLRALGQGHRLGIAWYLCRDETHNRDGRHVDYLKDCDRWRHLDPQLFYGLREIVCQGERSVRRVEVSGLLPNAAFSSAPLDFKGRASDRSDARRAWFQDALAELRGCSIVFADPDNSLCEIANYRWADRDAWKRMPLSEALDMAAGRPAVVYHHNNRAPGGHAAQIQHWLCRLKASGADALALYWRKYSQRTFFVIRPTREIEERLRMFEGKWATILCSDRHPACELHTLGRMPGRESDKAQSKRKGEAQSAPKKVCPECGHEFQGNGWDGIDAHWRAHHEKNIMPYSEAWPIIKRGGRPSRWPAG